MGEMGCEDEDEREEGLASSYKYMLSRSLHFSRERVDGMRWGSDGMGMKIFPFLV